MENIMTQIDLLTKHFVGSTPINAMASRGNKFYKDDYFNLLIKEIYFLLNQMGASQPTYQRKEGNQGLLNKDRD